MHHGPGVAVDGRTESRVMGQFVLRPVSRAAQHRIVRRRRQVAPHLVGLLVTLQRIVAGDDAVRDDEVVIQAAREFLVSRHGGCDVVHGAAIAAAVHASHRQGLAGRIDQAVGARHQLVRAFQVAAACHQEKLVGRGDQRAVALAGPVGAVFDVEHQVAEAVRIRRRAGAEQNLPGRPFPAGGVPAGDQDLVADGDFAHRPGPVRHRDRGRGGEARVSAVDGFRAKSGQAAVAVAPPVDRCGSLARLGWRGPADTRCHVAVPLLCDSANCRGIAQQIPSGFLPIYKYLISKEKISSKLGRSVGSIICFA